MPRLPLKSALTVIGMFVLLAMSRPARATPVSLNISGTMNLFIVGGPASSTYSGSISWDSTASFIANTRDTALFPTTGATLAINGTPVSGAVGGIFLGYNSDFFRFRVDFIPVGGLSAFEGFLVLPSTAFTSATLPGDLSFLGLVTDIFANFEESRFLPIISATLQPAAPTATPEPATLLLLGTGITAVAARRRFRAHG